jgi:putative ABC transport system permease protein
MNIFKIVWLEIGQRKTQLITGILAITLGISVIVAIRSISLVSEKAVAINLDNLGANILVLPQGANINDYYSADIDAPTFPEEYVEKIVTSTLAGVDNLSPKLTRRVTIDGQKVVLTGILPANELAAKPLWQNAGLFGEELKLACGTDPTANESLGYKDEKLQRKAIDSLKANDCLVGSAAAQRLNLKPGSKLTIEGREFNVAQVLTETGTVDDDRVFAHLHVVQELLGIQSQLSSIEIMGCCNAISDGLLGQLRNILPDTKITTIGQIVSTQIKTNNLMNRISLVILIIILVVGSVSIGNYMWANVNERKREIGILRMIGYSKGSIYNILLTKAVLIGFAGGISGYFAGALIAYFLGPSIAGINVLPIFSLLYWSLLLSVFITVIGSIIPAHLASKFEPYSNMQDV